MLPSHSSYLMAVVHVQVQFPFSQLTQAKTEEDIFSFWALLSKIYMKRE